MVVFQAVRVKQPRGLGAEGWVVQRFEPDGSTVVVSRLYPAQETAQKEADKLNAAQAEEKIHP
jgi:hypothetical protein